MEGSGRLRDRWAIREHRIPAKGSEPYICTEGPDGGVWFCQSGRRPDRPA